MKRTVLSLMLLLTLAVPALAGGVVPKKIPMAPTGNCWCVCVPMPGSHQFCLCIC